MNTIRGFRATREFGAGHVGRKPSVVLLAVPIVAAIVVAVVSLAARGDDARGPIELTTDLPMFSTLGELVAASDLVVVATVADVSDGRTVTAPDDPEAGFRTRLVELAVSRALVGQPPTPLVVEEPAELLDGTPVVVDGMVPLDEGDQAVWFLVAGESEAQPYFAVVNGQGRVVADGEGVIDTVLATR